MRASRIAAGAVAVVAACSSGLMMSRSDVASYDRLASDLGGAVTNYRTATSAMSTPAECMAALQQYLGTVKPDLDRMGPLAGEMDSQMMALGQGLSSDMRCGMDVMRGELARHAAVACTAADMGMNRAEAGRHADAMESFADHMRMRAAEAGGMMGGASGMMGGGWTMPDGGMMGWGHQMPGCTYADGGFTMMDGGRP